MCCKMKCGLLTWTAATWINHTLEEFVNFRQRSFFKQFFDAQYPLVIQFNGSLYLVHLGLGGRGEGTIVLSQSPSYCLTIKAKSSLKSLEELKDRNA
jgi:hypothetical protein